MQPKEDQSSQDQPRPPEPPAVRSIPPAPQESAGQPVAPTRPALENLTDRELLDRRDGVRARLEQLDNTVLPSYALSQSESDPSSALYQWRASRSDARSDLAECVSLLAARLPALFESCLQRNPTVIRRVLEPAMKNDRELVALLKICDEQYLRFLFEGETEQIDTATRALFCEALILESEKEGSGKVLIAGLMRRSEEGEDYVPGFRQADETPAQPKRGILSFIGFHESLYVRGIVGAARLFWRGAVGIARLVERFSSYLERKG